MAEINSTADLTSILTDWETRLRKLERQMTVPRIAYSSVATKETTTSTSAVALATADSVTLNTSTRTLISFYVRATLENSSGGGVSIVYVRDETAGANYQVLGATGTGPFVTVSEPGSNAGQTTTSGVPLGGYVNLYVTTAGSTTFSLRYAVTSGTGSFSNRLLLAQAQPF